MTIRHNTSQLLRKCAAINKKAEEIKVCCAFGRSKYRLKTRLCIRCRQRLMSIINKTC